MTNMNLVLVFVAVGEVLAVFCIKGGQKADEAEFPWAASVQREVNIHYTMGTLATLRMVIVACHPIKLLHPRFKRLYVMAGSTETDVSIFYKREWIAQHRESIVWRLHPECKKPPNSDGPWMHDYGVLVLEKEFHPRSGLHPIPTLTTGLYGLKKMKESLARGHDQVCTAIGWGSTSYIAEFTFGSYTEQLMKIQLRLIPDMECAYLLCQHFSEFCIFLEDEATLAPDYGEDEHVIEGKPGHLTLKYMFRQYICAQSADGGPNGVCGGDIGGSLLCDEEVIAITGWNRFCGERGYPSIHFALIQGSDIFKIGIPNWPEINDSTEIPPGYDDTADSDKDNGPAIGPSLAVMTLWMFILITV